MAAIEELERHKKSMKVYLLNQHYYEDHETLGVFDKKENAINFCIQHIYSRRMVRDLVPILNELYGLSEPISDYELLEEELE